MPKYSPVIIAVAISYAFLFSRDDSAVCVCVCNDQFFPNLIRGLKIPLVVGQEKAYEEKEKYKEGKYIMEKTRMIRKSC